jgi:hypothetical protein
MHLIKLLTRFEVDRGLENGDVACSGASTRWLRCPGGLVPLIQMRYPARTKIVRRANIIRMWDRGKTLDNSPETQTLFCALLNTVYKCSWIFISWTFPFVCICRTVVSFGEAAHHVLNPQYSVTLAMEEAQCVKCMATAISGACLLDHRSLVIAQLDSSAFV